MRKPAVIITQPVLCQKKGIPEETLNPKAKRINTGTKAKKPRYQRHKKKRGNTAEFEDDWQDNDFYFIAGYTSGGAPYGMTWEEMGLEPWQELDDI